MPNGNRNTVSSDFDPRLSIVKSAFDCRLSGVIMTTVKGGPQWLNGMVLDSGSRGAFRASPEALCCVLEQDTLTGSAPARLKNVDWDVNYQNKQTKVCCAFVVVLLCVYNFIFPSNMHQIKHIMT